VILQVSPWVQVAPLVSKVAAVLGLTVQPNGETAGVLEVAGTQT